MNDIVPKTVNFKELVETSSTTLSLTVQSKLVEHLTREFTEEQHQWYIANLYVFMHYHPINDFPINLEHIYKMIGFLNKANAKRTLKNNFNEDEDYKVVFIRTDENLSGGRPVETIMLNVDTFKNLCMMAKTDKGKEIRKYYVKLENIYNTIIKEELKQNNTLLKEKENELERTRKQLEKTTKLKTKKWYDNEPGHTVYGFISSEKERNSLITIGKSRNIQRRESEYMTCNQSGKMFHVRKCYNCDLTEKVLHHILDKYRCDKNREWFEISETLARYVIDLVCDFLDRFIGCSESLPIFRIQEFIQDLEIEHYDHKVVFEDPNPQINVEEAIQDVVINDNINVKDYQKFLTDCCDLGDNALFSLPCEIIAAYRIWCNGEMTREIRTKFSKYLKSRFATMSMYMENTGMRSNVMLGIKPKDLVFKANDMSKLSKYEEFCIEKCNTNYSYKILLDDFISAYKGWFPGTAETRTDIIRQLRKQFLVQNYSSICYVWGIQLKTDALPTFQSVSGTQKQIYMIDVATKEQIRVFESLSKASNELSLALKTSSDNIRFKKSFIYDNRRILLAYDKSDLEHVGNKRNMNHKVIHKFNVDTKQLLESYRTLKEAAEQNNMSIKTVTRYISIQQIFNTKNDGDIQWLLTYKNELNDQIVEEIKQSNKKCESGVVRIRPCKIIQKVDCDTNSVLETFNGILDAAIKMRIGECTVCRHLKSGKKLKINNSVPSFVVLKYAEN